MPPASEENEWEILLQESGRKHDKEANARTVVFLGDIGAGKRTMLSKLTKKEIDEEPLRGNSLGYTFMDVTTDHSEADAEEGTSRMNLWTMPGEEKGDLLSFAINKATIENLVVVIAVDLSQPHKIEKSLTHWTELLKTQLDKVMTEDMPEGAAECLQKIKVAFQLYSEPEEKKEGEAAEPKPSALSTEADDKVKLEMPIPDGVLTNNLGVPVIIVACKADTLETQEKEQRLRSEQIDYMQAHLRYFALKHGAALIYTSTQGTENWTVLREYMTHIAYAVPFAHRAKVLDRSTVFVPWGWDSERAISDTLNPSKQPYAQVLVAPESDRRASDLQQDSMLVAEDDQEFLKTQKDELEKVAKSGPIITSAPAGASDADKPSRKPSTRPPGTGSGERRPSTKPKEGAAGAAGTAGQPSDEALVNFFHSLLNRDKNAAPAPARKPGDKPK